ncbi:MAG: hypothetical protein QOG16_881 [Actinomycetota bacterium]|jgi:hypothetical protein|nr:hypothetical protein [Actinomycetota bacterium]
MKRGLSIVVGLGATACIAAASLANAAPAFRTILEDPAEDANFLNDQGTGDGSNGDVVTPADASTVTDILSLGVANDAKNFYAMVTTQAAAPGTQGTGYRVRFNPDADGNYCIVLEAHYPGATNDLTAAEAFFTNTCEGGDSVAITVLGNEIIVPRKLDKAFAKGATLTGAQVQGFCYEGSASPAGAPYPVSDTTKPGEDYKLVK